MTKIDEKTESLLDALDLESTDKSKIMYLCNTCKRYLQKDKLPPLCTKNGLAIEAMPKDLELSELEAVLCSKRIIFVKIHNLPKNMMLGTNSKVVDVPINSDDLRNSFDRIRKFPRQPFDGGLIPVKLKRSLSYKGYHSYKIINRERVINAVQHFKETGNPHYQDIEIDAEYDPKISFDEPDEIADSLSKIQLDPNQGNVEMNSQADQTDLTSPHTDSDEDDEDDRLASVKNQQFDQPQHFVMADDHPDLRCVTLHSSRAKELHLAPGQGKIPTNLMRDDSWDVCGFPHLHPKGQFGLHHPREVKISAKSYFMQRLQNKNPQFRKNKSYLFAAMYFLERQQFEQRINLSVQRGQISSDGSFCELKDAMSVFDNIKGTPKYWQKKRIDMIAKIEQLGPFQFFFTLSCADKRWDENLVSFFPKWAIK